MFRENGFAQSKVDVCLYFLSNGSAIIFVLVWVDDIVVAASTIDLLNKTKDLLKNNFKMKDLGKISWFLGIQFKQNEHGIEMNQSHYLKGLLRDLI